MRALALIVATLAFAPAAAAADPHVTFIGDSVPSAIAQVHDASVILDQGLNVTLELKVCRNLAQRSCTYEGETPPSALDVIRTTGRGLGEVVVINVGYNQQAAGYRGQLDKVIRALKRAKVDHVVWVTLLERNDDYRQMNQVIRKAAKRWPQIDVLDWARLSPGHPWFWDDGLHLNYDGAIALARLVRERILTIM